MFEHNNPRTTVLVSNSRIRSFEGGMISASDFKWIIPELENPQRIIDLVSGILYQAISISDHIMTESLGGSTQHYQGERPLEVLFQATLAESSEKQQLQPSAAAKDHTKQVTQCIRLVAALLNTSLGEAAMIGSTKTRAIYDELKSRLTDYVLRS